MSKTTDTTAPVAGTEAAAVLRRYRQTKTEPVTGGFGNVTRRVPMARVVEIADGDHAPAGAEPVSGDTPLTDWAVVEETK